MLLSTCSFLRSLCSAYTVGMHSIKGKALRLKIPRAKLSCTLNYSISMIQPPKNTKYRKYQRNYLGSTPAKKATTVCFGAYGLQCNQSTMVSLTQLETCRRMLRRTIKRQAPV